jgi:hypothetical protein
MRYYEPDCKGYKGNKCINGRIRKKGNPNMKGGSHDYWVDCPSCVKRMAQQWIIIPEGMDTQKATKYLKYGQSMASLLFAVSISDNPINEKLIYEIDSMLDKLEGNL